MAESTVGWFGVRKILFVGWKSTAYEPNKPKRTGRYNCYMLRSETSFISDLWGSTNITLVVKGAQVSTNNQLAINFKFETSIWFWTHLPLYTFHFLVGWTWALLVVVAAESGIFLGNGAIVPQEFAGLDSSSQPADPTHKLLFTKPAELYFSLTTNHLKQCFQPSFRPANGA